MKKHLLPSLFAVLAAGSVGVPARSAFDGAESAPIGVSTGATGVELSTGATSSPRTGTGEGTVTPGSGMSSWTEIRGKVVDVDRAMGRIQIQENGTGDVRELTLNDNMTLFDKKMAPITIDDVRKGHTVTLRNKSDLVPPPAPVDLP